MTNISFNLSGKLDSSLVEVLREVNQVATALGIRFFVVGAMARDIVLEFCHAIRPARGIHDLDIGVEVSGRGEFQGLSLRSAQLSMMLGSHPRNLLPEWNKTRIQLNKRPVFTVLKLC